MQVMRSGDMVEVRSSEEILATLDAKGALEGLPFMPEMLKYCGQRYKIYKRADKTGQYSQFPGYGCRRMFRTVFLEGLRCDGEQHDGCDSLCLLYWKEAWLKKIDGKTGNEALSGEEQKTGVAKAGVPKSAGCTREALITSTKAPRDASSPDKERYSCQVTEIMKATSELKKRDYGQYYRDLRSGNIGFWHFTKWAFIAALNRASKRILRYRIYPYIDTRLVQRDKTPHEVLNLQVGDYVQIKSLEEILQTLNSHLCNRGLMFTKELIPYCGSKAKVIKVVRKTVSEVNGEMIHYANPAIVLENVICDGTLSDERMFCQKSCYPFWREIWLKRI